MKKIVITQNIDNSNVDKKLQLDRLDHQVARLILELNYCPIPIPNCLEKERDFNSWVEAVKPDGIVLSGGNDIGSRPTRDDLERKVLKYSEKEKLPIMGVCRGMQFLAFYEGLQLRDAPNHVNKRHRIFGKLDGEVNSYHKFVVEKCPENYKTLARSEDGYIESFLNVSAKRLGLMWHPEREHPYRLKDLDLISNFFS